MKRSPLPPRKTPLKRGGSELKRTPLKRSRKRIEPMSERRLSQKERRAEVVAEVRREKRMGGMRDEDS